MRIIRDWRACPESAKGSALALGNFDGVHKGHQAVIARMLTLAREEGAPAAVMTFEPHPRRLFAPHLPPLRITPFHAKARLLRELGVEYLFVQRFTRAFSEIGAESFLHKLLLDGLGVRHIVTGADFIFGHRRSGDAAYLEAQAALTGRFAYTGLDAVTVEKERCSSTAIRRALEEGDVARAAHLLGRPYVIEGRVREGDRRGRTIGFPTANIIPARLFLPAFGVYAVRVEIAGKSCDGVANFGLRPTFGGDAPRLEVHCFADVGELYGKRIRVALIERLRPERKFEGIEALKAQIEKDAGAAREILARKEAS